MDIAADLNAVDETGYAWAFLDDATDQDQIRPGAIVSAGHDGVAADCEVVDLVPAAGGTIVHLRVL